MGTRAGVGGSLQPPFLTSQTPQARVSLRHTHPPPAPRQVDSMVAETQQGWVGGCSQSWFPLVGEASVPSRARWGLGVLYSESTVSNVTACGHRVSAGAGAAWASRGQVPWGPGASGPCELLAGSACSGAHACLFGE